MLEQMRRQGASIFVYLIFCLLILIFVINFRPGQSRQGGDDGGCTGTNNNAITVDGVDVSQNAFKIAYYAQAPRQGKPLTSQQRTALAFEILIRRELLAQAAEARGLDVDTDLVVEAIQRGEFFFAGNTVQIPGLFDDPQAKDRVGNPQALEYWMNQLNVSRNAYIEEQRRGMLAAMMGDILRESVQVSRGEALSQFEFEGNTVTYDAVEFRPDDYAHALQISDADLERWSTAHADEIAARFKADEKRYKATKPALLLRQIFIAKKDAKDGPKAPGMTIEDAKAKLEAVRTGAAGSKDKFAAAAKDLATEPDAKARGGALGWYFVDAIDLGEKAVSDAAKALKPGEITAVIATDRGAYLVMADDKREGDLKLEQVKREIAEELAKDAWGKEAAKRAALATLDAVRKGNGMNLSQVFKPADAEQKHEQDILNDPSVPEPIKEQIRKQMKQGPTGDVHGALEVREKDQPAGWFEDDVETGSAAGAAPSAAPAAGSAVAAAGSAAAAAPAVPAAPVEVVASKDVLPPMSDVPAPPLERFGPTPRQNQLPGLGDSKPAAAALFDELSVASTLDSLPKHVFEADGSYVVLQLVEHKTADIADFNKAADQRIASLREVRAAVFMEGWLADRCRSLAKANRIHPNQDRLVERDDQGKLVKAAYQPCDSFR